MSAITSPLAIVLNLLVIIAVAKKRQLRAIYNILLASMAVADFLIGVVARPLFISTGILRLQNDYETMCSFVRAGFLVMYVQSAYICHLTVIAWERYVAVKKRVTYKLIVTRRRMKICIIVAWVLTAISVVPSAMYRADHIGKKPFAIASACVSSIPLTICLVSTVYYYMTIYLKVRQTNANSNLMNGVQVANVACARASLEKEIAKTAFLLTVALLVSFVPTFLLIFLKYLCDVFSRDAFLWSVTLNQMNSFVSPILYFYRNRRFRNTVLLKLRKLPTIPMSPKEANRNMVMQKHAENSSDLQEDDQTISNSWEPTTKEGASHIECFETSDRTSVSRRWYNAAARSVLPKSRKKTAMDIKKKRSNDHRDCKWRRTT